MCLNHECYRKDTHGSILLLLHFFTPGLLCLSLKILVFMMVVSWNPNVLFRVLRATEAMITYKQKQTFRLRYVWKFANLHMCHFIKRCCEFCEWWHEQWTFSISNNKSKYSWKFCCQVEPSSFVFYAVDNTVEHESSVYNTLNLCTHILYGLARVGLSWVVNVLNVLFNIMPGGPNGMMERHTYGACWFSVKYPPVFCSFTCFHYMQWTRICLW